MDDKVRSLSKLILSHDNQVWIMNLHSHPHFVDVLTSENTGCSIEQVDVLLCQALASLVIDQQELPDWDLHNLRSEHLIQTRSRVDITISSNSNRTAATRIRGNRITDPISNWVRKQLLDQNIPDSLQSQFQDNHLDFPSGLLVLPTSDKGIPRIVVPKYVRHDLIVQAHLDIHHQHYRKVHKLLRSIYYWPSMDSCIEKKVCKQCPVCEVAKVRRQKLQSDFDAQAPQTHSKPRQHYGIDFYGIYDGEILVTVDLFIRETILEWLPSRKQETVVQTLMRRVVFERGVPFSIRSDNAPELIQGIVRQLCAYLNITQILTGGHNPRGNAICERANQTLGGMICKLNDHEYKNIRYYISAFQFAMNTTPHSATGCSPFEAGYQPLLYHKLGCSRKDFITITLRGKTEMQLKMEMQRH
jgi:hypothetical protein